jgi:hypothetical protein
VGGGVMVFCFIQKKISGQHESYNIYYAQIMKITNGFFNPISAFAQTNLIIELKLIVYLFSKKLGTDHLTSRGWGWGYVFFLNKYSDCDNFSHKQCTEL